jgi:CRP-like cAMP-binding protein
MPITVHSMLNPDVCTCSPEIRHAVIDGLPFLKGASDVSRQLLRRGLRSEGLLEGREISPLRYPTGLFGVIARGAVKVYRFVGDDEVVIFDVLGPGDWFLYGSSPSDGPRLYLYPDQLTTLTTCCVLTMDRSRLDPVLKSDPALMAAFFQAMTDRLAGANERFVRFMAFSAEHRLAFLLGILHRKAPTRIGRPGLIPFNLTRKDLASMAGLTLETVSRILTAFEDDGLVQSGRGWVEILNFEELNRRSHLTEA